MYSFCACVPGLMMPSRARVRGRAKQKPPDFTRAGDSSNHLFSHDKKKVSPSDPAPPLPTGIMTALSESLMIRIIKWSARGAWPCASASEPLKV